MEVNTSQIQWSRGTVYGDCSLRNWWWIQQVLLKPLYIYSRLQGVTSTVSNLNMVTAMKSSLVISCVKMEFAANVSNTLGASVMFNCWLWVSWWLAISLILSAQDNGNNLQMNSIFTWLIAWEDELAQLPWNFKSAPPSSHLKYRYSFMEMKNT